jgi:hypothetical protein
MYNKAPIYVLPACACGALCNKKKDEKRFLRRHPAKCKARASQSARGERCEGAKPYGSLPGEQETLDLIRLMRTSGATLAAIAASLNASGVKPRRGTRWHPYAVSRIAGRA